MRNRCFRRFENSKIYFIKVLLSFTIRTHEKKNIVIVRFKS
ncbi:hypothetical protein LEP1GSC133_4345 [Leptospira borgpetersenii serovar Pomona str. 200901868]|uniref:Uncharacterized protein n=5 Tax=Leptospira borgpetersenii TaxID=174 RepID=M3GF00_LEPBO|nr:hypothetical protein LBBP_02275 [Leptospira borgpetersenii serovar Ballum]EKP15579.1 hypothetical protein LEP1GSC128_0974 [Leptospira borgpetersenii str. 200801926]EKQ99305.1 hypothetical protein LEP1GSC121_2314 [Leptospira borgpetersenii serovar Castellonis str. 200801910]EMF99511.1 hypothetical protein LEP1GSC123_0675 [Leptospira borgpetersenii str. 200701203]EMN18089.1 hypothetical protein LEP1GSC056_0407 [Leptospira borgpetersenii str. Brem 328]EMO08064.1 hypothetical protein LEP1GSC137